MKLLLLPLLLISFQTFAQCKSSKLNPKGERINCVDQQDQRQGKWVNRIESLRGEPGYEEEGAYKDGKKEGTWRLYTLMGDLFAIERYRWGNKDGVSQYFSMAGLSREESWKAVNPENPYDTIEVPDPINPYKVQMKVVKIEGTSVKHGTWKYYDEETGRITKTEKYLLDKIEDPFKSAMAAGEALDSTKAKASKPAVKVKPPAVLEFEKKNAKRKIKVIDGSVH
jgi:antitoxin component YwqK of YwqJK toxin-antitoxin module